MLLAPKPTNDPYEILSWLLRLRHRMLMRRGPHFCAFAMLGVVMPDILYIALGVGVLVALGFYARSLGKL